MQLTAKEARAFSWARVMEQATGHGLRGSLEAEILEEATRAAGGTFGPHSFVAPWALLGLRSKRDLTVAGVSGSQYLVGEKTDDPAEILRPFSATVRAGVRLLPGQVGNVAIPKINAAAGGEWLPDELSPITATQPTVGSISCTPKTAAALLVYSHQFRAQAQPEGLLESHLLATVGELLDRAILNGAGSNGEPQGLSVTPGVTSQAGAALAWSGILAMEEGSSSANGEPSAWIAHPDVREILKGREKAAGSGFIWEGRELNGAPAFATTAAPSATLFCGPWSEIVVPIWGSGPSVAIDPSTYFTSGRYQMRVMLSADVAIRQAAAFVIATSIS